MSTTCHGKKDMSVLAGPYLRMGNGFAILCKVCGGKMLMAEELPGKAKQWSCTIISKTIDMCQ